MFSLKLFTSAHCFSSNIICLMSVCHMSSVCQMALEADISTYPMSPLLNLNFARSAANMHLSEIKEMEIKSTPNNGNHNSNHWYFSVQASIPKTSVLRSSQTMLLNLSHPFPFSSVKSQTSTRQAIFASETLWATLCNHCSAVDDVYIDKSLWKLPYSISSVKWLFSNRVSSI